jgi:gluconate 2-dehydrogenase gamma chain
LARRTSSDKSLRHFSLRRGADLVIFSLHSPDFSLSKMQSSLVAKRLLRNGLEKLTAQAKKGMSMEMDNNQAAALDRRALIQRIALLLGATAIPSEAYAATKARARKRFLNSAQFALMNAVADTIIPTTDTPGAIAAGVPATLDGMLANWASVKTRSEVLAALGRIDAAAKAQKQKSFAALSPADRAAVLRPHDAAALKAVPPPPGAPKLNFFTAATYVADPGYHTIKDLVINLYYYSEVGTSNELVYEHNPGTFQPSLKVTPQSRPYLGLGPF